MSKFNFFERMVVNSTAFEDMTVDFGFNSTGIMLLNESDTAGDVIYYSFDGLTVHGDLRPGTSSAGLAFDLRHESQIWLARETSGGDVVVRVEAWM